MLSAPPLLEQPSFINVEAITVPSQKLRRYQDSDAMQGLIKSIAENGVLEPIWVRPVSHQDYELVAGERRLLAAKAAGLLEVPARVRQLTEIEALKYSLIENLQRENLNPLEETEGILKLLELSLGVTVDCVISLLYRMQNDIQRSTHNVMGQLETQIVQNVFNQLGQSWESFVNNRVPLLKLPQDILTALREGKLAYTKAKAIARIKDPEIRSALLSEAINDKLSLSSIRKRATDLTAQGDSTDAKLPDNERQSLISLLDSTYKSVKVSKVWSNPDKQHQLKQILHQLQELIAEA